MSTKVVVQFTFDFILAVTSLLDFQYFEGKFGDYKSLFDVTTITMLLWRKITCKKKMYTHFGSFLAQCTYPGIRFRTCSSKYIISAFSGFLVQDIFIIFLTNKLKKKYSISIYVFQQFTVDDILSIYSHH